MNPFAIAVPTVGIVTLPTNGPVDNRIDAALVRWQSQLLQLNRRNDLLYFKGNPEQVDGQSRRRRTLRCVPITNFGPDQIDEYLQGARKGRTFDFAARLRRPRGFEVEPASDDSGESPDDIDFKPGDLKTDVEPLALQPVLLRFLQKDREWQEEQGINVLFLAVGFLEWIDEEGDQAKSPLLLLPCDLKRSSPRDPFVLSREDDDATHNATLRHKLSEFRIGLPEFEHDTYAAYLDKVSELVSKKDGWRVTNEVVLATFQYTKLAMWEDLQQMRVTGVTHPLVRRLAGEEPAEESSGNAAGYDFPEDSKLTGGGLDDVIDLRSTFAVLPADHSQLRAVAAAGYGHNLVIHGPPGTGKSQTIVNIISNLLAHGKRVLFVSEKSVALDVVKERLERENLGVFCLDMHSDRARKSSVYGQLRHSLEDRRLVRRLAFGQELESSRGILNDVVRALHEARRPLGRSIYQVHGEYALLRGLPDVEFSVPEVEVIDEAQLNEIITYSERIKTRPEQFRDMRGSIWRSLKVETSSIGLADRLRRDAAGALEAVKRVESGLSEQAENLGARKPIDLEAASRLRELAAHIGQRPLVFPRWLQKRTLAKLRRVAGEQREMQKQALELSERVEQAFGGEAPTADYALLSTEARPTSPEVRALAQALGDNWPRRLLPAPASLLEKAVLVQTAATGLVDALEDLAGEVGAASPIASGEDGRRMIDFARDLVGLNVVLEEWTDLDDLARIKSRVDTVRKAQNVLDRAEAALFAEFDPGIVEAVDNAMLIRFRTDHQSGWQRLLGRSYRRDLRRLRGYSKAARKLTVEEGLSAVQRAVHVREMRQEWDVAYAAIERAIGQHSNNRETDWERVEHGIESASRLLREWPWDLARLQTLLTSREARPSIVGAHEAAADALRVLEDSLRQLDSDRLALERFNPREIADIVQGSRTPLDRLVESTRALALRLVVPPEDWWDFCDLIDDVARLRNVEELERKSRAALSRDFGEWFTDRQTDWGGVLDALSWCQTLLDMVEGKPSERVCGLACGSDALFDADLSMKMIEALESDYKRDIGMLDERFDAGATPWGAWTAAPFADIENWLEAAHEDADSVGNWIEFRQAADGLDGILGAATVQRIRDANGDSNSVPGIVERRLLAAWLDAVCRQDPRLCDFTALDHEGIRRKFSELDRALPEVLCEKVREAVFTRYPGGPTSVTGVGQIGVLRRELTKKRRQISVRRLLARCPTIIQALKPCFLMSPLAVSQYLERTGAASADIEFDTVIFDEASQVLPEDAVTAIARAEQAIVVGDQKQLPPTSFFQHRGAQDDADDDGDDTDWFEGRESILDVLVGMAGGGAAEHYLAVHYRSRHESLIRYSNHYFYDDRLLTFPNPRKTAALGVQSVYLTDGRYDAGGSRTNRLEAEKVVELVFDLMRKRPTESVGVVTLSRAQADRVETLVDEARMELPEFDHQFAPEREERFFVKNLENVQGDERDHVVMSVGYGPSTESGKVYNRFGPINTDGGERRLNVAVSRARRSMTVVHSLKPQDISSETQGARLLKLYLEFARNPDTAIEQNLTVNAEAETESPFEEAVRRALIERGHRVDVQVGVGGYRIDLAIQADDRQGYALGIECDGATYHNAPAARDRDWLRQSVLEDLGWRIYRVWSRSWIQNPERELQAIDRALHETQISSDDVEAPSEPVWDEPGTEFAESPAILNEDDDVDAAFDRYQVVELPRRYGTLRVEPPEMLYDLVAKIVNVEGPVHVDLIIKRIRLRYGIGRVRGSTRKRVYEAIAASVGNDLRWLKERHHGRCASDVFLATPEQESQVRPRAPHDDAPRDQPSRRKIEHIPLIELKTVILARAELLYGASRDDLIVDAARRFGFKRTGKDVKARIGEAVDQLVAAGRLVGDSDMLTVAD